MDYEKKYKETLERARKLCAYPTSKPFISDLQDLFPELKQSEGRRIRKDLIDFLEELFKLGKNTNFDKWSKSDCAEWCVWLEKQGEPKPVPDWMPKFLDELRSKKNYFDWEEHKDIEGGILAIINWMNPNYFNEKEGEQNPAWSEEDEKQARQIERIVHNDGCTQKLQKQIADWFKSLKDRCTWKPSLAQINALSIVSKGNAPDDMEAIVSLYQDLKKLREE